MTPYTGTAQPTDPDCPGRRHGTRRAYEHHQCRCDEAVDAMRRHWRHGQPITRIARRYRPKTDIDAVLVARAITGEHPQPMRMTIRERVLAAQLLTARGLTAGEIAARLDVVRRTVARYRARPPVQLDELEEVLLTV